MVVYVCCAGGATSSMFCARVKKAAEDRMKIYVDDIETVREKFKLGELGGYDMTLCYGAAEKVNEGYVSKNNFKEMIDLVLVSPQVRFLIPKIKEVLSNFNIPCEGIDMKVFGTMNGEKALELIMKYSND